MLLHLETFSPFSGLHLETSKVEKEKWNSSSRSGKIVELNISNFKMCDETLQEGRHSYDIQHQKPCLCETPIDIKPFLWNMKNNHLPEFLMAEAFLTQAKLVNQNDRFTEPLDRPTAHKAPQEALNSERWTVRCAPLRNSYANRLLPRHFLPMDRNKKPFYLSADRVIRKHDSKLRPHAPIPLRPHKYRTHIPTFVYEFISNCHKWLNSPQTQSERRYSHICVRSPF